MSFSLKKVLQFPQGGLNYLPSYDADLEFMKDSKLLGGVLRDTCYIWQAKGSILEIRNTKTGSKVGEWVFGGIIKDSNTKIVCVEEILSSKGRISHLLIGVESLISGGIICIFDVFSSMVIKAIQIKETISCLHVIDPAIEDLNLPGPLRTFDGILAIGTNGGDVILLDICKQICEESLHNSLRRDERNPSQIVLLNTKHIQKIEDYKDKAARDGNHIGIHLNAVLDNKTEHFVLKGPRGDDRIHVNNEEVKTSAIYYCPQLASILVGYNFGAFQLWDLTNLKLVYTSPVCEVHFPITNFALQEPTDDPRAFCYVWVSYSNTELLQTGLPFAVMYSFCYKSKEYHEGYGYLYQDFTYCNIRYQMELGQVEEHRGGILPKGGYCLAIQPITKHSSNKELLSHSTSGDTLALCLITWTVWFSKSNTQTCSLVFDLNQWYKEQMPSFTQWKDCSNYILRTSLSDLVSFNGHKPAPTLNVLLDEESLTQFIGVQRLEEHFYPTSLSFDLWILRENDIVLFSTQGSQKSLLVQITSSGPLCLIRPSDFFKQAIILGLAPLFVDISTGKSISIESQREIILNIALEHRLIGWLCRCASDWANGSFSSAGCSLDFLIAWAFQRALVLKTNCHKFCAPLFDYSQSKLDTNATRLLSSCMRQISCLCLLYKHITEKLKGHVTNLDVIKEHSIQLKMVSVYYEVIQWLINVGLLPECHPSSYPRVNDPDRISAPYTVDEITEYYIEKRAELALLSEEFSNSSGNLLYIDNLINKKCGGSKLQTHWQQDGGSGLYPPPSLQSLVRTYLVDGADVTHKHSLLIYLFLDLAVILNERYSSVVDNLSKFPTAFRISPSIIKITQAFWQLDHGDFASAIEKFVDPSILADDFQPWHHTVAMRSLLMHKQPTFALMYLQKRKPPISFEKDVLMAIGLFVANDMLDEAFYFKNEHKNENEEKLLIHLFHECTKNDSLHCVLYKSLNPEEEKIFFKYLKSAPNPSLQDLQIYYYLLRSRFIEAFDTHSEIRRRFPYRQGLTGQSQATETDQIIRIFKSLMPDVNKNLMEYVRRERNGLWKEVNRPTPMSVFVHNTNEQVQYKSSLIYAALSKAKHTFQNGFNEGVLKDLTTEQIPFLRTPTATKNRFRIATPVITPKIINNGDQDLEPTPSKRRRLSARLSTSSIYSPLKPEEQEITLTPIVKRKISYQRSPQSFSNFGESTPQSILKVRPSVQNRDSNADIIACENDTDQSQTDRLLQSTSLKLSRSSLSRTPTRQHVHFDEATRRSSTLSDQSIQQMDTTAPISSGSSRNVSTTVLSTDLEEGSDEVFYSPDNSGNSLPNEQKVDNTDNADQENRKEALEVAVPKKITTTPPKEENVNVEKMKTPLISSSERTPKARRSYKRSLGESSPTRSSPRLSKIYTSKSEEDQDNLNSIETSISEEPQPCYSETTINDSLSSNSKIIPRVKGRKSLSRQVLEHNTFLKIHNPSLTENISSKEITYSKSESITVTEKSADRSKITSVESNFKTVDTSVLERNSPKMHKSCSSSSSTTKKQVLEETMDSDLSSDSFQLEESNESGLLSESLREYIDNLMHSKKKNRKTFIQDKELSRVCLNFENASEQIDNSEVNEFDDKEKLLKDEETQNEIEKPSPNLKENEVSQLYLDKEISIQVKDVQLVDETTNIELQKELLEKKENVNVEEKAVEDLKEVEVYVVAEDMIEDPLPAFATLTPLQVEDNIHDFVTSTQEAELPPTDVYDVNECYKGDETFNELEENIFGLTGEESNQPSLYSSNSHSSDVPDAEKAYIYGYLDVNETKDEEVVVISSSEEDRSLDSSVSSNSEVNEENFNLNVSHDPNISENSDDSDYSKTTEENLHFSDEEHKNKHNLDEEIEEQTELKKEVEENYENLINKEPPKKTLEDIIRDSGIFEPSEKKLALSEQVTIERDDVLIIPDPLDTLINKEHIDLNNLVNKRESVTTTEENVKQIDQNAERQSNEEENSLNVDNSTNTTTIIQQIKIPENDTNEEQMKCQSIDSATNTTVVSVEKTVKNDKISPKDTEITNQNVINETVSISERKVKDLIKRKLYIEDPTTSSSDTTEGESFRKEIVTAQVHNSDTSSKNKEQIVATDINKSDGSSQTEEHPARRVTRKTSDLAKISEIDVRSAVSDVEMKDLTINLLKEDDIIKESISQHHENGLLLGKRGRRARSETPARTMSRRLSDHLKIDCNPDTSLKLVDQTNIVKISLGRKRSQSIDEVRTFSRKKTSKGNSSIEEADAQESNNGKSLSVSHMPVVSEKESTELRDKPIKKAKSVLDSYTTSRRLTRRQASIVKDIKNVSEENRPRISLEVEPIDPLVLLDKDSFEGKPDPDEKKVYEPSSPSTSTNRRRSRSNSVASEASTSTLQNQPSTPRKAGRMTRSQTKSPISIGKPDLSSPASKRKRSRSNSVVSEVSTTNSLTPQTTPEKVGRNTRSQTKSPVASVGVSTRSRKLSETSLSEQSEVSTTPKRTRKKKADAIGVETTARTTRSRTVSESSVKSGGSSSSKKVVKRGRILAKPDLPEIREENVKETLDEVSSMDKRRQTRRNT